MAWSLFRVEIGLVDVFGEVDVDVVSVEEPANLDAVGNYLKYPNDYVTERGPCHSLIDTFEVVVVVKELVWGGLVGFKEEEKQVGNQNEALVNQEVLNLKEDGISCLRFKDNQHEHSHGHLSEEVLAQFA